MRKWTDEEREKQSQAIQKWRPWEKSTGPKTWIGKSVSAQNSWKHGLRQDVVPTLKQINRRNILVTMHDPIIWNALKDKHAEYIDRVLTENPDLYIRLEKMQEK